MEQKNRRFFATTITPQLIEHLASGIPGDAAEDVRIKVIKQIHMLTSLAVDLLDQPVVEEQTVVETQKTKAKPKTKKAKPKAATTRTTEDVKREDPEKLHKRTPVHKAAVPEGQELRRRRNDAGLTQTGLAKLSGVHEITISRVERGHAFATKATARKLAKVLGGDFETLVTPDHLKDTRITPAEKARRDAETQKQETPAPPAWYRPSN